jgi:hypothetical protein
MAAPSTAPYDCRMKPAVILVLFAALLPGEVLGETVTGVASVIDGDTIDIRGTRIRLFGIDAPEVAQRCTDHGKLYPCGLDASHALAKQIGHKPVSSVRRDTDRYGRMVAVCTMGSAEVNRWMIKRSLTGNNRAITSQMKTGPGHRKSVSGRASFRTRPSSGTRVIRVRPPMCGLHRGGHPAVPARRPMPVM